MLESEVVGDAPSNFSRIRNETNGQRLRVSPLAWLSHLPKHWSRPAISKSGHNDVEMVDGGTDDVEMVYTSNGYP